MNQTSRRKILAGAGATVAGGAAAVGLGGPADAATPRATRTDPVVAWVEDPSSGEVHVMSGEAESVVHDHALVSAILRAAGGN